MTRLYNSNEQAWRELDRMLSTWASQVQTGRPMTRDKKLEIFGGPKGQSKAALTQFLSLLEKRGIEPAGATAKGDMTGWSS